MIVGEEVRDCKPKSVHGTATTRHRTEARNSHPGDSNSWAVLIDWL